jgi:hypothetical protein
MLEDWDKPEWLYQKQSRVIQICGFETYLEMQNAELRDYVGDPTDLEALVLRCLAFALVDVDELEVEVVHPFLEQSE